MKISLLTYRENPPNQQEGDGCIKVGKFRGKLAQSAMIGDINIMCWR